MSGDKRTVCRKRRYPNHHIPSWPKSVAWGGRHIGKNP